MLAKLRDFEHLHVARFVGSDEASVDKLPQQAADIAIVVREDLGLDAQRPELQAAFAVGERPEPDEEQTSHRLALGEVLVLEERGLDATGACQLWPPSVQKGQH